MWPANTQIIRFFVVRMNTFCVLWYLKCAQRRFRSDCANADLNFRWAHMSEGTFSDFSARLSMQEHFHYIYNKWISGDSDVTRFIIRHALGSIFTGPRTCRNQLYRTDKHMQTELTQLRCRVLRHLTWVYTVWTCYMYLHIRGDRSVQTMQISSDVTESSI